eukprot:Tbor_TRINITY_DN5039_c0_g2::TRINITY_DN5039_c0_g2_i2::g.13966::m.13966
MSEEFDNKIFLNRQRIIVARARIQELKHSVLSTGRRGDDSTISREQDIINERDFIEYPVDACMLTQEALAASASSDLNAEYKDRVDKTKKEILETSKEITSKPFLGFGLSVDEEEKCLMVDNVFVGSPAHQVGVRPGHRLLRIAGTTVKDLDSFRNLMADHCKCGEFTHFSFRRPGESISSNISVWVMTSDDDAAGKYYYFDVSQGVRITNETNN